MVVIITPLTAFVTLILIFNPIFVAQEADATKDNKMKIVSRCPTT